MFHLSLSLTHTQSVYHPASFSRSIKKSEKSYNMEGAKNENANFLDRTSRATRGRRMTKLLDDEIEEDENFWNQDALIEEEVDENYEEEEDGEMIDVFDSDFEDDETEPDEDAANEPDDRQRTKKKLTYPGNPSTKKKKKHKILSEIDKEITKDQNTVSNAAEDEEAADDVDAEKIVRKSTRTSVIVRQAERDAIRAALQATVKPVIRKKKEGEEKRMTQEEMLLEAAQTEIMNLRNLERVLAREEEVKKRAVVHKAVYDGPQIRYLSRNGESFLEFSKGVTFQKTLSTSSRPYPEREVCAVTGLPAKYRDPQTGLPYATKEAFRIIRERLLEQRITARKSNKGSLTEMISGQGFSKKRKRSVKEVSDFRFPARFLRFPSLETQDSE